MELLITFVIVVLVCLFLWWLAGKLPHPIGLGAQIVIVAGAAIWLLTHVREIIRAIAGS